MNDWKKVLEQTSREDNAGVAVAVAEKKQRASSGKKGLIALFIVLLVAVLAIAGFWVYKTAKHIYGYDRIYPGVTALNLNLGGMTVEEAEAEIREYSANYYSGKQIEVKCGDESEFINAKDVSIVVDAAEVARQAYNYGRIGNFFKRYRDITSDSIPPINVNLVNGYDISYVENKIDALVASVNVEFKQYSYVMTDAGITITKGRDGITINRENAVSQVKAMLESNQYGVLELTPEVQIAVIPDWSILRQSVYVEAKDAVVKKSGSRGYYIEPHVLGKDVDLDRINADMQADDWEIRTYPIVTIEPEVTDAKLSAALFRDVLATVTTRLDKYDANRTQNVRLSAEAINGYILLDYDDPNTKAIDNRFSFNDVVGERTEAKGYKNSVVFTNEDMVDGIGGGICQTSSTLYVATLLSDMKVVERHTHTFAVDYVDLGMDATVQWGYLDYVFENNTGYPVRIEATVFEDALIITFRGTNAAPAKSVELESRTVATYAYQTVNSLNDKLAPGTSVVAQEGKEGYKAELYQIIYNGPDIVEQRLVNTSYYRSLDEKIQHGPTVR